MPTSEQITAQLNVALLAAPLITSLDHYLLDQYPDRLSSAVSVVRSKMQVELLDGTPIDQCVDCRQQRRLAVTQVDWPGGKHAARQPFARARRLLQHDIAFVIRDSAGQSVERAGDKLVDIRSMCSRRSPSVPAHACACWSAVI